LKKLCAWIRSMLLRCSTWH